MLSPILPHVIGNAGCGLPVSHARTCSALPRGFLDEQPI
jgi:hypothetical protein